MAGLLPILVYFSGSYDPQSATILFFAYTIVMPSLPFVILSLLSRRRVDGLFRYSQRRLLAVACVSAFAVVFHISSASSPH